MVALKTERRVFLWRVRPHCEPEEATKPVTLEEIISILEVEHASGRARAYLSAGSRFLEDDDPDRDETNQLYVADIRRAPDGATVTLLVNRGDPNAVATAYLNTEENTVRVDPPQEGEVPGYSAHLIFLLAPERGRHREKHRACFEKMPRVSSSLVLSLVNRIIARAVAGDRRYVYMVDVRTKNLITSRPKPYRPTLDVKRVPSERLINDLQQGVLSGLTLTKSTVTYRGPGRGDLITDQEQKVVLKLARDANADAVSDLVASVQDWGKEHAYTSIQFHLQGLPHGQSNNPTVPLDDQDAMEQLYVRAQVLTDFAEFLEACYPTICDAIEAKMIAVLADVHGW